MLFMRYAVPVETARRWLGEALARCEEHNIIGPRRLVLSALASANAHLGDEAAAAFDGNAQWLPGEGGFYGPVRGASQGIWHFDPATLKVSINSHAFLADTSQEAADAFYPSYAQTMTRIGRERGWPPTTREQFEALRAPRGALLVGSPQEVIEKILFQHELFGHQRFLLQMGVGTMPHDKMLRAIELFGTKVAPAVRKATAT